MSGPVDDRRLFRTPYGPVGNSPADGMLVFVAARQANVLCLLIVAANAAVDLATANINLSILYALPMALWARSARPAVIWRAAAALVLLSYAGYFLSPWPPDCPTWESMFLHYRLINRTVSCVAIVAIASMSHFGIILRRRFDSHWEALSSRETDREVFVEVVNTFEQFLAGAMTTIAVVCVAATDLLAPIQYNPATLYAVPILACARTRSRWFLWATVVITILLAYAGYTLGPATHLAPELLPKIQRNRRITAAMIVMVGVFVHIWIGIDYPSRRRQAIPQPRREAA